MYFHIQEVLSHSRECGSWAAFAGGSRMIREGSHVWWSSYFASYLEDYLMEKRRTWDNGLLWLKDRPCKIYVGQWPIFHGPLILPYIIVRFKLFLYIKKWHRLGIFVPLRALALVDIGTPMFDLKINVGHIDLYYMVQWFCLISWGLFDVWTSYFRIMS